MPEKKGKTVTRSLLPGSMRLAIFVINSERSTAHTVMIPNDALLPRIQINPPKHSQDDAETMIQKKLMF